MNETQPFKYYYGVELARDLASRIQAVLPTFAHESFVQQVAARVDDLELKDRVALISAALHDHLPSDYPAALHILLALLGPENTTEQGMFTQGYHLMPLAYFVEVYGLDHFDESFAALYEITKRHTAESAIRPFLIRYPQQAFERLHQWVHDKDAHIRRLVSEGTRPRLPWAARLHSVIADPTAVLGLLEYLKNDPSAYVRKSVANNLNDILKDHPELVLAILERWREGASPETLWIMRHALRNLVKQGHPRALRLLEVEQPAVKVQTLTLAPESLRVGDTLHLALTLRSEAHTPQNLIVDYIIHFVKANGTTSPKVFKLRTQSLDAGETLQIQKKHSLKPITTRRYYAGLHRLEIQVNGQLMGEASFLLKDESTP